MKKITTLLMIFAMSLGYAQTFPIEFSDPLDAMVGVNGCTFAIVQDAGNDVGSVAGGGVEFDYAILELAENLDLSDNNNNTITFRVKPTADYGTRTHLLKFEAGTGPNTELTFTTTGTDWQDISLNYGAGLGNYGVMVLFTDFNNTQVGTYLFDDFAGGTNVAPPPPPSAEFPIDFETPDDTFICYDCAFSIVDDAGNAVGSVTGGGIEYDTAQLNLGTLLDLSDDANNTITFRIKPVNGTGSGSHLLKFEGGSGPNTELPFTTTGTEWQDISIDYPAGLGTYSLVVLFTDFANFSSDTYLIDDFAGGTNVGPPAMPDGPAPTPTTPDASVFRLYGDTGTYTNNMAYDYTFGTLGGEFDLDASAAENKALQFDFSVAGWGAGQDATTDASTAQFVHFDYWATNATDFKLFLISNTAGPGVVETTYEIGTDEAIVLETWTSVTIPIAHFTAQGYDVNNFFQYKYDVTSVRPGIVYIDNLYLSDVPPTALGVEDFETVGFKAFPNPSQNEWTIKSDNVILSIELYDLLGKQVISVTPNSLIGNIDASLLSMGVYLAKINIDGVVNTVRLIKN